MSLRISFGVVLVALAICGQAWAGALEDGIHAFNMHGYEQALQLLRPLAEQGDASAQFYLGEMYHQGHGVPMDQLQAATWYRRSAEQGNARSMLVLGDIFGGFDALLVLWGHGKIMVERDDVQAYKFYSLAAAHLPKPSANDDLPYDGETVTARLDRAVHNRDEVAARLPPAQLAEAQKLVNEWKPN